MSDVPVKTGSVILHTPSGDVLFAVVYDGGCDVFSG